MDSHPPTSADAMAGAAGYYAWCPPGANCSIYLNVAMIDRLNFEVMRGYGAVPKRGAEVGGLLLGTVEQGEDLVIRIEEFVPVPCEHLRGPSYILSGKDLRTFDAELQRWSGPGTQRVVGLFRSNTRELLQLGEEDLALLDSRLPQDDAIVLLIKPYTTRPCEATFIRRVNGHFPRESRHQTFVFRRKDLGGGGSPAKRVRGVPPQRPGLSAEEPRDTPPQSMTESSPRPTIEVPTSQPPEPAAVEPPAASEPAHPSSVDALERPIESLADLPVDVEDALRTGRRRRAQRLNLPETEPDEADAPTPRTPAAGGSANERLGRDTAPRYRWVWVPLSLVFLLLGIVIGVELLLAFQRAQTAVTSTDPYEMDLTASRFGGSFLFKWNPNLPAVRQAKRGELTIEQSGQSKTRTLSADELAHGSVVVTGATELVRFRLTLLLRDRMTVSETVEAGDMTP